MKKALFFIFIGAMLTACGSQAEQNETPNEQPTEETTETVEEVDMPQLEEGKVYPFMELKEIYGHNWQGEMKGNADFDGKTTTITGEVFSSGKKSKYADGAFEVIGAKLEFRGSEFADPDFGHDVECTFPAEIAEEIDAIEKGTMVTVKGVIEKQEGYIEPGLTYTVLTLKDCELIQE